MIISCARYSVPDLCVTKHILHVCRALTVVYDLVKEFNSLGLSQSSYVLKENDVSEADPACFMFI